MKTTEYGKEALPPPSARLYDPTNFPTDEPFPTAIDSRGLVDIPRVIEDVSATIVPNYVWRPGKRNHHFYWPAENYSFDEYPYGNLQTFRNLPSSRGLLPREFERWLHEITLPPETPDREVRQYCIDAWAVAHSLFTNARERILWDNRRAGRHILLLTMPHVLGKKPGDDDSIAEEYMNEVFTRNFKGLDFNIKRNEKIPPEFRLIEHDKPVEDIVRQLRPLVNNHALNLLKVVKAA